MAEKNTSIRLVLEIPADGSGTATLAGRKGEVGVLKTFPFADQNDMAAAIYDAAWELANLEIDPPALTPDGGEESQEDDEIRDPDTPEDGEEAQDNG